MINNGVLFRSQKIDVFELLFINRKGLMKFTLKEVRDNGLEIMLEEFFVELVGSSEVFEAGDTEKKQNFLQRRAHHILSKKVLGVFFHFERLKFSKT